MTALMLTDSPSLSGETDAALVREYARGGGETAFAELVRRHAEWVMGVALRSLSHRELAQEVTQNVFILLARKAARVKPEAVGPWLHRTTVLECRNARRRERTRHRVLAALTQQQESDSMSLENPARSTDWSRVLPVLDEALNLLPEMERELIVARFFQRRNWREIGASQGRSEGAARMALAPALKRLEKILRRRGVCVSVVAIEAALSVTTNSTASAAPAALARNALAAVPRHPVAHGWSWKGVGLTSAACFMAGSVAGYQFLTPHAPTPAPRVVVGVANPASVPVVVPGVTGQASFDLAAVLDDLRALQPSGNDVGKVVRLRAALMDMPSWAVPQVFAVLRGNRWGSDSADVAAAFFCRWAELDVNAAWAAFREPDLLGAVTQTLPAIFDGMDKPDTARFVTMVNSLPESEYYAAKIRACLERFDRLTIEEMMPHLVRIQSPALKAKVYRWVVTERPEAREWLASSEDTPEDLRAELSKLAPTEEEAGK